MNCYYFLCFDIIAANDLHVSDGRGTEAQNCKPITNLKEKSELSIFCKTSAYRLHAVRRWQVCPAYFWSVMACWWRWKIAGFFAFLRLPLC
jgi:hypothetical protein